MIALQKRRQRPVIKSLSEPLLRQMSKKPGFSNRFPQLMKLLATRERSCTSSRGKRVIRTSNYSGPVFANIVLHFNSQQLADLKLFAGATSIQLTIGQTVKVL